MNLEIKETQCKYIFKYLIDQGRFDLIDLLAASDRHEIHILRIKRMLVSNIIHHNVIIHYLKRNGVEIVYPNGDVILGRIK
jgi:hypothetical protein